MIIGLCFLLGLLIGSFLNVVIWRLPRGESLSHPGSHCPGCGHAVRPYDNVPVVSWLVLRGRCRDCGARISPRYPLVELLTGVLFGVMAWEFGATWELPAYLYLAAVGVALAFIDLDTRRLPNALTLPSYVVGLVLLAVPAVLDARLDDLVRAVLGAAALFGFYFLLALIYPAGMGFGDVKLAGVLGLYLGFLGWDAVIVGGFAGFLIGAVVGVGLMVAGRARRRTAVPFGPSMLAGTLVGVLWGSVLGSWYLGVLGGDAVIVGGFAGCLIGAVVGVGLMVAGRARRRTAVPFGPSMLAGTLVGVLWGSALGSWYLGVLGG